MNMSLNILRFQKMVALLCYTHSSSKTRFVSNTKPRFLLCDKIQLRHATAMAITLTIRFKPNFDRNKDLYPSLSHLPQPIELEQLHIRPLYQVSSALEHFQHSIRKRLLRSRTQPLLGFGAMNSSRDLFI